MAQLNVTVGDISGNCQQVLDAVAYARDQLNADIIVTPELALTGYPPEDLVLRPGFMQRTHERLNDIIKKIHGIDLLVGHPWLEQGKLYNSVSWIRDGQLLGRYHKQCLPNYAIFDEKRYFHPGNEALVVNLKGCQVAVVICEDCWEPGPINQAKQAGAQVLLTPNASPYRRGKHERRLYTLDERMQETGLPMAYCNLVGGQDELLFDGRSLFLSPQCPPLCAQHCQPAIACADFNVNSGQWTAAAGVDKADVPIDDDYAEVYTAICLGVGDYFAKNGFSKAVLGLSGGIDSATWLSLC